MLIRVISVQCYSLKIAFCMLPSVIREKKYNIELQK